MSAGSECQLIEKTVVGNRWKIVEILPAQEPKKGETRRPEVYVSSNREAGGKKAIRIDRRQSITSD